MTKSLTLLMVLGVCLTACIGTFANPAASDTPYPTYLPHKDSVLFEIIPPAGDAINITYGDMLSFDQVTIEIEGKEITGIRLQELLKKAGVGEFHAVTASGGGRSISLAPDQINEKVLLSLTKNYTVKLISPQIPKSQWVTLSRIIIE